MTELVGAILDNTAKAAVGTVLFSTQPGNNDTVTINGKVYTFQTTLTNINGHVLIGQYLTDTADNLAAAINALSNTGASSQAAPQPGVAYAAATTAHPTVSARKGPISNASGVTAINVVLTAKTPGTAGNSLTLAHASPAGISAITVSGATLTGGASVLTASGQQNIVSWYGGECNIDVSGTWGGASVQLQCCTRIPTDLTTLTVADWIPLGSPLTANGQFNGRLNPCLLSATVTSADGTTTSLRINAQAYAGV